MGTAEPPGAHHILDLTSHSSLRMALPSLPAPHPTHGGGRTALSQPVLGGRAEQLLLVSLPLPVEKGTVSAVHASSGERHCWKVESCDTDLL